MSNATKASVASLKRKRTAVRSWRLWAGFVLDHDSTHQHHRLLLDTTRMRKTARVDFTKVEGTVEEGQRWFAVVATAVAPMELGSSG